MHKHQNSRGHETLAALGLLRSSVSGTGNLEINLPKINQTGDTKRTVGIEIDDKSTFTWDNNININMDGFSPAELLGMEVRNSETVVNGNFSVSVNFDGNGTAGKEAIEVEGIRIVTENAENPLESTITGNITSKVTGKSIATPEHSGQGLDPQENYFSALSIEKEGDKDLTVNLGSKNSIISLSTEVEGLDGDTIVAAEVVGTLNMTGKTISINSNNTGAGRTWGLAIGGEGAKINLDANDQIDITSTTSKGRAFGIASFLIEEEALNWSSSGQKPDEMNITAPNITINAAAPNSTNQADAVGIYVPYNTTINLHGNVNINANISKASHDGRGIAIMSNPNSTIHINEGGQDSGYTSTIIGDIQYVFTDQVKGDSLVEFVLNSGRWVGNHALAGTEDHTTLNLRLGEKATWTITNPDNLEYFQDSPNPVNYATKAKVAARASSNGASDYLLPVNVILQGGTLDASELGEDTKVKLESLKGTSGTFITNVSQQESGKYKAQTALVVDSVEGMPGLTTTTNSVQAGQLTEEQAQSVLQALASTVTTAGQIDQTVLVTDQAGGPDVFAKVPENGQITADDIVYRNNSVFDALETAVALGTSQWRAQIGSLFKRLGEVRDDEGNIGAWVRVYQNRVKWNSEHNDTFTVQIGADYKFNNQFIAGGAFNYSDGNTKLNGVKGDNHAWGFAMYGTWLGPDGIYVDLEGKYNRLDNKITSRGNTAYMHGKYKGNAWSLSAQSGWTLPLSEMFFVEPQAQLSWGQAGSDTFSTGTYNVKQKAFNVVEGRLGAKAGVKFPEKRGQAYAKASVVYDWASKFKGSLATNGVESKFNEDLGGCAGEFAVGGQFNMTKNAHVYADVTTRVGGKLKEPFQWTVGLRYSF